MKYVDEFRDAPRVRALVAAIRSIPRRRALAFMEVCGTHTMAIARYGIRRLLPDGIRLISGPGCPVCVTPVETIDAAIAMAREPAVTVATFGDLLRVPGSRGTLEAARAEGAEIRVVYSTLEALALAREDAGRRVVFIGIGFETTAPTVAGAILEAARDEIQNFFVLCAHKTMPEAMRSLSADPEIGIDGFLCPGHVSTVTGPSIYAFIPREFGIPCAIAGFEPADVLDAVRSLLAMHAEGRPAVENLYPRAVRPDGNARARAVIDEVFEPATAVWRGLGPIPRSGLAIRSRFAGNDAERAIPVEIPPPRENPACRCGHVLTGRIGPRGCPLFGRACTPDSPVGPCMVSSEGSCAAEFRYGGPARD
ncbi:MAG: hydrogenase formation protein HypD [Planctomycetes bacterium]|nr:hydrogenase formation protein HypD [Planctomycetota bacterium]